MMKKLAIAAVVAASMGVSAQAMAAADSVDANVTVIKPVSVTGNNPVNFGVLSRASSGNAIWTVSPAGALTADAGNHASSVDQAAADHGAGDFTVSGEGGYAVTVSVAETNGTMNGVTLSAATADNDGAQTLDAGTGDLAVNVGATVTIADTAASATGAAGTIELTANY